MLGQKVLTVGERRGLACVWVVRALEPRVSALRFALAGASSNALHPERLPTRQEELLECMRVETHFSIANRMCIVFYSC